MFSLDGVDLSQISDSDQKELLKTMGYYSKEWERPCSPSSLSVKSNASKTSRTTASSVKSSRSTTSSKLRSETEEQTKKIKELEETLKLEQQGRQEVQKEIERLRALIETHLSKIEKRDAAVM